jgi:hypothetical protein
MTADPATIQQTERYMTPMTKQNLLNEIALGRLSLRQLAGKYSRSYVHIRDIASTHKAEIEHLKQQYKDELSILWVTDRFNRQLERQIAIDRINVQQEALIQIAGDLAASIGPNAVEPVQDRWDRLEDLKQKILKAVAEEEGQLPTRAPAVVAEGSKMTYEVKGVDVAATVREWAGQ